MSRLGIPLSADTLIRRVKGAARLPALPQVVRVLGVDDWAWRKGQTFGTILVDLERRQVVDLLPTRSADSLVEWLAQHPEVTTVSRDRQGVYAEGARLGAPEACRSPIAFSLGFEPHSSGGTSPCCQSATPSNCAVERTASAAVADKGGSEESNQADPSPIQRLDAADGSYPAAAAAKTGAL